MAQLEPTYRDALIKSWKLIIHHKMLWVIGAMAALVGQFGLGNVIGNLWSFISTGEAHLLPWIPGAISWPIVSTVQILQFSVLFLIMMALVIFIIVVAVCAQGMVISAATQYFSGRRSVTLHSAWHAGAQHFWRLLIVNVIQQIVFLFTLSAMFGFWRDFSHTDASGVIMLVIGMTLGLFIAAFTSILSIYTAIFVVDKEYTLSEAVGSGYELFKEHILVSLEVSALLLIATVVPVLGVVIAAFLAVIPGIPFWLTGIFSGDTGVFWFGTGVSQVFLAILVALINGAFTAFSIAAWVYCYRMMEKKGVTSRIVHHTARVFRKEPQGRTRVVRGRVL